MDIHFPGQQGLVCINPTTFYRESFDVDDNLFGMFTRLDLWLTI
jgi:hypothetical protein